MQNANTINVAYRKYLLLIADKRLKIGYCSSSGRNFSGRICVHHRGGGVKRNRYFIDFHKRINSFGFIVKIIKTAFYSAFVGMVVYENGLISYQLLADNHKLYSRIFSGLSKNLVKEKMQIGFSTLMKELSLFSIISQFELYPYYGSQMLRAAGAGGFIIAKAQSKVTVKLKSG